MEVSRHLSCLCYIPYAEMLHRLTQTTVDFFSSQLMTETCRLKWIRLPRSTLLLGYLCLTAVVLQWVTSGFVAQYITYGLLYKCTITQTVYTLCFYSVLLIPHLILAYKSQRTNGTVCSSADLSPLQFVMSNKIKVSILGGLWLCGQVVYVMSLLYTSMGTNTAVSSSSSAFSFVFSMIVLGYAFRWLSGLGVAVTITGVVLTAIFPAESTSSTDSNSTPETVEGIIMAVSAAACFGLFSCLYKKWIVKDNYGGIVFGSFGVVAFIVGIPIIIIAHFAGLQTFVLPDWKVWLIITADAIMCCFVNNVCLSRAFVYLTPVIVLVGLTMTTPLSIFVDAVIFSHHNYSTLNIVGLSLITIAVLVVGYDQAIFEKTLDQRRTSTIEVVKDNQPSTSPASAGNIEATAG
jgi:solute carrier family 35 protein F5